MLRCLISVSVLSFLIFSSSGCGTPPKVVTSGEGGQPSSSGSLKYRAPEGWSEERTTSNMRVAQYRLPRAEGDEEDASLVVFYFQGTGGSAQANLDRWIGQVQQADGSSSKDKAKTETRRVNGLDVTLLDVSGTYTAEMTPGGGDRANKPGFRLRAAVIETPKGPYFIKLAGPEKTIARWDQAYESFINSFEFR